MFRELRRKRQELPLKESIDILMKGTSGVLALSGDEGYPYAVPISYVYRDSKLYFHGAKSGHKIDAVKRQEKASFCVIAQDEVIPEKYTTAYKSVIVFGRIRILEDETEIKEAVKALAIKYHPDGDEAGRQSEIDRFRETLCVMEMSIEHICGKEGLALLKARQ